MKNNSILGVIPARFASSRFPGKPLIDLAGKTMIQRVYEQAIQATCLQTVVVATDDERIADAVKQFGGNVMMTAADHLNGTERVGEVARQYTDYTHIINIQGDEPLIDPEQINALGDLMLKREVVKIATLLRPISDEASIQSSHIVKAVRGGDGRALYFSRATIPFPRNAPQVSYFQHVGMYGFRREVLLDIIQLAPSPLELTESLEQLRWLYHGYDIHTAITELPTYAIDTPEDVEEIIREIREMRGNESNESNEGNR